MAGMKFNADIDLKNIVKLRQEIDKLKKSLIEIASVPNSDAAIKQLESEIDRATKKLSEYKDSYAKLQKIKYDIDSSSSTVKRVKEETSALQSTNKWIIANTESVKEADRQIKQLKKDFSALSDEEKVGDTGTAKIRQIQQLAAQRLVEEEAVRKTIKAQKDQIIQSNAEEGSITALRKQLILLIKDYDDLGRVRRGGDAGKALLTQISNVQKELNAAEQASGRFQRNVGNYASAWNGLGNSVQQVARELPSLAVSANTFFLAISNNLPILVDEIAKARKEYANFKAELKAGNKDVKAVAPVWQQLTRSILSWQTALVVGLTLLSVYGKDVIKWIGSLGKARDVTLDLLSAEQEMALARKSAWSSIAKEQTQLDILYNKLKNVTLSTTERNAAVREWVKNYKTHSDILDGENVDLRKLENAYRALSKEIYANAVARAYADRIAELSVQREKEEMKRLNQKLTIAKAEQELERVTAEYNKKANEGFGTATAKLEAKDKIIQARKNVEDQKKIYNDLVNNVNDYDKNITVISNHIKTLDLFPQPKEGTYDYWQQQVEIADNALKQITSEQKKVLDEASKNSKKDLYGLGIDRDVVDSYNKAVKDKAEAEKQLKVYGDSSKEQKMAEKEAEKRKKEQEKLNEELLSLRRQNQQAEIDLMEDGTEKKLKQIDLDYQKELDAIKKQEKELSEKQKGKLTSEQSIEISDRYTNAENKRDKAIADITKEQLKAEQQALNDYLKEYGTFQQQKFAIAQEYAEKIKKVQEESGANSAQVKLLEKQRDVAIQNKETEAIKANIDWVTVFGEFGSMFNDMIKPALEEAKKYVQTDKFKSSDQDSQKALIDAINQMEQSLGGAGGLNFKKLGQDIKAYQLAEQNRLAAIEEETMAHDKLAKAQDDYTKALKSGTEEEKKAAQNAFEIAQQNANAASINVQAQTSAANEMQQSLTNTATALKANMENVTSGLQKLSSGGIKNAYEGLLQIGKGAGGAMEKFADKLDKVPIVGWIISIIDVFKDGLSDFVGTLLDSVFNAVSGILSDVLSGDLFVTLGKSIRDGVSNIFNAISFGGFDSLINKISGSNAKEVQEAIDRLTDRNETLEKSIDRLTDVMDKSAGSKSISAYEQAYKYQKEQIDNTLKIAREQARYSNSHHSWQYYMEWNDEQLRWVRENVDKNFSGTNSLWGLTPEQMRELLSNADIYEQIKSSGKGGYGERVMEKLEAYADQAGKLDELTEKINESLMQISFDGLRDNFLESLMDMDKDAKSFSEDFSEYMQRALLNFSMGELFDDELREWYNGIAKLMKENGGKLTKQQLEDARKEYDAMVQDAINERDKIAEITGYTGSSSSSQEASKKGFATASQDSIDELNGRFTALQIAGEEIKNQNQLQTMSILELRADMLPIIANTTGIKDIASETRDLLRLSYEELTGIHDDTTSMNKSLKNIETDIAEVKRNTSKL